VLERHYPPATPWRRARGAAQRRAGEAVRRLWAWAGEVGAIGPDCAAGRRFGRFGEGSIICFPHGSLFNERYIQIGAGTMIGPDVVLSAGMVPGQQCVSDPVVRIGDRCLIGRGSGIVGHLAIDIGDDVWTGHHVYITDQNHGYEDVERPISAQVQPERPVTIGDGSWLGHGAIVLPGSSIVAAGSVVTGPLPDYCVAAGVPARPLRQWTPDGGWVAV
jgi:acetyltransferase-like isoleucine patch superfamily enzyme